MSVQTFKTFNIREAETIVSQFASETPLIRGILLQRLNSMYSIPLDHSETLVTQIQKSLTESWSITIRGNNDTRELTLLRPEYYIAGLYSRIIPTKDRPDSLVLTAEPTFGLYSTRYNGSVTDRLPHDAAVAELSAGNWAFESYLLG
jgi:hypothetical protein